MPNPPLLRLRPWLLAATSSLVLAACGGGGGGDRSDPVAPPATCSVADQQRWLGGYMDEWYFWYGLAPRPDPARYATVDGYFEALLYTGISADFPADRWSRSEPSTSFNRFFGDGQTLGYGVSVNGIEAVASLGTPLLVRYVEPQSDAAAKGVRRGDEVVSVNGRAAAALVAADDFGELVAERESQLLRLVLRRGGVERTVDVEARVFALTPVTGATVYNTAGGRRLGYLAVKDMISQAQPGLASSFASLQAQGVHDLVLDLRYNGGGLISVGASLGSYVAGSRGAGKAFATLLYNDKRAASQNERFGFTQPAGALGLPRVLVLTGPRTCSAAEQVINGLRGAGVQVVTVGDTSCGKPVGSLPREDGCGTTYSVINFESVNERHEGRYFEGFDATCPVSEDWSVPQGDAFDPLVITAAYWADTGSCAPVGAARKQPLALRALRLQPRGGAAIDERSEMLPR